MGLLERTCSGLGPVCYSVNSRGAPTLISGPLPTPDNGRYSLDLAPCPANFTQDKNYYNDVLAKLLLCNQRLPDVERRCDDLQKQIVIYDALHLRFLALTSQGGDSSGEDLEAHETVKVQQEAIVDKFQVLLDALKHYAKANMTQKSVEHIESIDDKFSLRENISSLEADINIVAAEVEALNYAASLVFTGL